MTASSQLDRSGTRPIQPIATAGVAAAMAIGTMGVMIAGVQPVLFGALLSAGRITATQIGHIAAAELIAIGIGVVIAEAALERAPVWLVAAVSLVLLATLNLATIAVDGNGVLLVRALAGLPAGALVWTTTAVIVRSPRPTQLSAAFLLTQAILQFATSTGLALVAPQARDGVPITIACLCAAMLVFVPLLPRRFMPLPKEAEQVSGLPPLRGWVVLLACLLIQGCIVGAWVYFEPLGRQAGMTPAQLAFAVPASLGAQVTGGIAAILLSKRVPWFASLVLASTALAALLLVLSLPPGATIFFALETVFGALWIFVTPFLTPLSIKNDPTRRTALLVPSAVLIGSGLGPLAASALASEHDAARVLRLCALLAIIATALIVALQVVPRNAEPDIF